MVEQDRPLIIDLSAEDGLHFALTVSFEQDQPLVISLSAEDGLHFALRKSFTLILTGVACVTEAWLESKWGRRHPEDLSWEWTVGCWGGGFKYTLALRAFIIKHCIARQWATYISIHCVVGVCISRN